MQLTLQIRSHDNAIPADHQLRTFSEFPIVIGRSKSCNYVLVDPDQYISSKHATIYLESGQLIIEDTSSNGVFMNSNTEPLGRGQRQALFSGDLIVVGSYTLIAELTASTVGGREAAPTQINPQPETPTPLNAQTHRPSAGYDPFKGNDLDWTPTAEPGCDPFDDDWQLAPEINPSDSQVAPWMDWPDDFKVAPDVPASDPRPPPHTPPAPPPANTPPSVQPLTNEDSPWIPEIDSPREAHSDSSWEDWPDDFKVSPSAPDQPQTVAPIAPHINPTHTPTNEPLSGANDSLHLLIQAAKLRPADFTDTNDSEILQNAGYLLAQMVDAMIALLQSRAELKNAIRSDVTMLSHQNNNPLKFSLGSSEALTRLLCDQTDGFNSTKNAVDEATQDLIAHQVAVMQGMKASVKSLLLQFDPTELSKTLEKKGGIGASIPISREAKLWKLFCQQYDAIYEEAVVDFGERFSGEFRKAYEQQINAQKISTNNQNDNQDKRDLDF